MYRLRQESLNKPPLTLWPQATLLPGREKICGNQLSTEPVSCDFTFFIPKLPCQLRNFLTENSALHTTPHHSVSLPYKGIENNAQTSTLILHPVKGNQLNYSNRSNQNIQPNSGYKATQGPSALVKMGKGVQDHNTTPALPFLRGSSEKNPMMPRFTWNSLITGELEHY